ncbi:GIP [Symbiodinium natans]|uniref:GIP protein n=1 Tax=Symbiodinium natans TaxID=878477 RepID=A0A812VBN6_9DINO|nr:GIP [Symbiodinium natans]
MCERSKLLQESLSEDDMDMPLSGVCDVQDCSIDHVSKIYELLATAVDCWELDERNLTLTRHHHRWRMGLFSPEQCRDLPVPLSRFTGERVTTKLYGSGVSPVEVRDADFLKLADKTAQDTVRWKGKCVFKLRHKPALRYQGEQSPRLPDGKTKFFGGGKTDRIPPRTGATTAPPPTVSRSRPVSSRGGETAEADACLSRLRSLDCATALDVERVSTDQLWADRYTYFTTSTDESRIDTGFQDLWSDMIEADGSVTKCEEPRADLGHTWTSYCLFEALSLSQNWRALILKLMLSHWAKRKELPL